MLNAIPGVSCRKPKGAIYMFPKLDHKRFAIEDDAAFMLELLLEEKMLLVQGTAFNWPEPNHMRLVFLPRISDLKDALTRFDRFLGKRLV